MHPAYQSLFQASRTLRSMLADLTLFVGKHGLRTKTQVSSGPKNGFPRMKISEKYEYIPSATMRITEKRVS